MLLQIDSSPHPWLEKEVPIVYLIGAIDDATGKVPYAFFQEHEDNRGYFLLLQGIVERYGGESRYPSVTEPSHRFSLLSSYTQLINSSFIPRSFPYVTNFPSLGLEARRPPFQTIRSLLIDEHRVAALVRQAVCPTKLSICRF